MLLLSTRSITVDGVTVFPDHADPQQFWYLPAPVTLAKMPDSDEPQFLLIMYAPDVASSGVKGIGFLNVTVALPLSDDTRAGITNQLRTQFGIDEPHLAPVPFDEGTVQIVTLDMQGSGGTTNAAPPGAFVGVEKILGAVSPELYGDNNALFALTLSEDGASILKAAFENGMAPVGAIYNLKFTGVRPALDVKITADLKRCYQSFSVGLEAQIYWVSAGIDATFEKLRQDGAIKVEVVSLSDDPDNKSAEERALSLFKDQILSQWFTPSLSPTTEQAADVGIPTLPQNTGGGTRPPTAPGQPGAGGGAANPLGSVMGAVNQATGGSHPTMPPSGGMAMGGTTPPAPGATSHPTVPAGSVGGQTGGMTPHPPTSSGGAQAFTAPGGGASFPATGAVHPTPTPIPPTGAGTAPHPTTPTPTGTGATPAPHAAQTPQAGAGGVHPPAPPAGVASGASSSASPFGIALKLKYVQQDEQKTVTYEYNRMDAVQRSYAPQGYFGLLLNKVDKAKHFLEVDGTDPFFKDFAVTVAPPRDFASIGLQSAHVAIDYGDPALPAGVKHGEFIFDGSNPTPQVWDVYQGLIHSTEYRYMVDYTFDPESGWVGEHSRYQLDTVTTENRQLTLDPRDTLGFLNVNVVPGHINADLVDRIDVSLQYQSKSGWQNSALLTLRPGGTAQNWKLRLSDKTDNSYSYSTRCTLKDGTVFDTPSVSSTATAIFINDPFEGGLNINVQPALDAARTKLAIVEIAYRDPAHDYNFETSLELTPNAPPQHVRIPIVDRTQNSFQYRITTISVNNQRAQGDYVSTPDTLVFVGDTP